MPWFLNAMEGTKFIPLKDIFFKLHGSAYDKTTLEDLKKTLDNSPQADLNIPYITRSFGAPDRALPLKMAIESHNPEEVEILLKHKANPNVKDKQGRTALILNAEQLRYRPQTEAHNQILTKLLEFPNINLSETNKDGKTALDILKEQVEVNKNKIVELKDDIERLEDLNAHIKDSAVQIVDALVKQKELARTKETLRHHLSHNIENKIPHELVDKYIIPSDN